MPATHCTAVQSEQGKPFWKTSGASCLHQKLLGERDGAFELPGHKIRCLVQVLTALFLCLQQNFTFQAERRIQFQTECMFVCRSFAPRTGSTDTISCHHHTYSESSGGHFYFLSWHSSPVAEGQGQQNTAGPLMCLYCSALRTEVCASLSLHAPSTPCYKKEIE